MARSVDVPISRAASKELACAQRTIDARMVCAVLKRGHKIYIQMSNHGINHHIERFKESFLCAAARGGRIEECASLLDFGADIEWRENKEDNPLLAAVRNGMNDVAALLLAHGANPGILDQDGNSVMHLAAFIGDESMSSLFSPNAYVLSLRTNNDGMTGR